MPEKTFRLTFRSLVALLLLVCLIALPVTAIGMETAHTREFADIQVRLYSAKHVWRELHVMFGILFVASGVCHALLNRRLIANYLMGRVG
jgi:uncharacterized membrane protein